MTSIASIDPSSLQTENSFEGESDLKGNSINSKAMTGARKSIRDLAKQQERRYDPVRLTVNERWVLQHRLGKGGFGTVYSALDKQTGELVAVKMETENSYSFEGSRKEMLKHEFEVMETINQGVPKNESVGFPHPIYYASSDFMRVMVMDLLGDTIMRSLSNAYPKMVHVYNIGIQLVGRLEHMHEMGVLHLDLKTDNIYFGRCADSNRVYLADFGLSERYLNKNGKHRSNMRRFCALGTNMFSSQNVMSLNTPSRRDDIESLGYVLIFIYFKILPWIDIDQWHLRHHQRNPASVYNLSTTNPKWEAELFDDGVAEMFHCSVEEMKSRYPLEKLCMGLPGMKEFLAYARGMSYEQRPDYSLLRHMLARKIGRASIRA